MSLRQSVLLSSALLAASLAMPVSAGTQTNHTFQAESYNGSKTRQYAVYQPDGLSGSAPMVMTLHGCKQTQNDILNDWGMKDWIKAGIIVVVVLFVLYKMTTGAA